MESLRTTLVVLIIADSGHSYLVPLLGLAAPGGVSMDAWALNEFN